jgi:hypothetical protein
MPNIFYHSRKDKYVISDIELCGEGSNIDIKLFDIGLNEKLMGVLKLVYYDGNNKKFKSDDEKQKDILEHFCHYLAWIVADMPKERRYLQIEKSLTNPTVRIHFFDKELLERAKLILKKN